MLLENWIRVMDISHTLLPVSCFHANKRGKIYNYEKLQFHQLTMKERKYCVYENFANRFIRIH
ncbi:unnamed protein product [Acanthoscelides obtectus]|uniref:Uncharacterized protein n=1 Tax=Acanthoscelides obtectus TaxID=200917 RepID=A0A9P0JP49_ACAOB|nr:unnamed protein product [Acanthoscelides obtectus]CAK1642880.1 hypothetical protein AOBTE_LOCUS13264 [Acanthoscelides obtectus]